MGNTMDKIGRQLKKTNALATEIARVYRQRLKNAQDRFSERMNKAFDRHLAQPSSKPPFPADIWASWQEYSVDFFQRSILFWATLQQRGNNFLEHQRAGKPPVLHFEYEMLLDAREFERPVNYALVRIVPPEDVAVGRKRRPYIIIDPRAGHGPGIGGFKDDSQVGVALRDGHPVYFIIFFPEPEPGQTLLDVCDAERSFVHKVRELHPDSPKPVLVGNCQAGWAAMMLSASYPEDTGPVVLNGAPMSYWGGAWSEGEGDNPMRYFGGLAGGSWLSSLLADLGDGVFDGAFLVQNFESLNPANSYWDKYYNLFSKIDTEPPRFLDFERWWGGFYLLNREEIEWTVQNLFVGNKLWSRDDQAQVGRSLDLREIKSPIILFASMGDNITPPQQAFNWVADVYGSTDEIKSRGQVIVGLLHREVGHLGIFVSGSVAKKEYAQIVSVLKSIEALPPGLYGMEISETKGTDGIVEHEVAFVEHRLEEIIERFNKFKREDEKAFEAVAYLSEFNQTAYELFVQPMVSALSTDLTANLGQTFHPIRFERWAISDLNPWLVGLRFAAEQVNKQRKPAEPDQPFVKTERMVSELISASLDYYRGVRDSTSEALFYITFGNMFNFYLADKRKARKRREEAPVDPRQLPFVKEALESVAEGGYPEAVSRVGYLLQQSGEPLSLARLHIRKELMEEYSELFPDISHHERRRIRGEQEIICRYEPEKAIETLPTLLADPEDRQRFQALLDLLPTDPRFLPKDVAREQSQMLNLIKGMLARETEA
jgi:pimeloyl-ACP methyl ester carboxylesterase